jgi:hypothetical protein
MGDQFEQVEVGKLLLDHQNPRLPTKYKKKGEDDSVIINWMLSDATLLDLMASIAKNKFFQGEPIIVIKDKSNFIVVEGNRRLASIKLLAKPSIAKEYKSTVYELSEEAKKNESLPSQIWVYIVQSRDEVANYLGFRHVTGTKDWPPLSKARYLTSLYGKIKNPTKEVYEDLAKEIGSSASYVRRLLIGYQLFLVAQRSKFYGLSSYIDEESFNFTLIADSATMHKYIYTYIGINYSFKNPLSKLNEIRFKQLFHWLYLKDANGETRVGENRNLKILNRVLSKEVSTQAFVSAKRSLREADELTDGAEKSFSKNINKSRKALVDARNVIEKINQFNDDDKQCMEEVVKLADNIFGQIIRSK